MPYVRFTSKTQPTLSRKQKRQLLDKQEYVREGWFCCTWIRIRIFPLRTRLLNSRFLDIYLHLKM